MTDFLTPAPVSASSALPQRIRLRMGEADDEPATFEVMKRAMNIEAVWEQHQALRDHLRTSDKSSFWLAEERNRGSRSRTVGYARSIVREDVWALTEFFLLPEYQHRGVGRALLSQVLQSGTIYGAKRRLILASHHPAADALYIKRAECTPRQPMFLLSGSPKRLKVSGNESDSILDLEDELTPYRLRPRFLAEPILLTAQTQQELDSLDREVVGFVRPQEHAFWSREMSGEKGVSRLFRRLDERGEPGGIVGYAYTGLHCGGPALAQSEDWVPRFCAHVTQRLEAQRKRHFDFGFLDTGEAYASVPGTNGICLRWLLGCGWRITAQFLLMSDFPLGSLERYLGYHPVSLL